MTKRRNSRNPKLTVDQNIKNKSEYYFKFVYLILPIGAILSCFIYICIIILADDIDNNPAFNSWILPQYNCSDYLIDCNITYARIDINTDIRTIKVCENDECKYYDSLVMHEYDRAKNEQCYKMQRNGIDVECELRSNKILKYFIFTYISFIIMVLMLIIMF